jgi:hypothetical protein
VDDFVVGTPDSLTGSAYVYFGSSVGLPTRGATLTGELNGDQFGWSVAIIGDINNDGIADVAVGAPEQGIADINRGSVYIYHGPVVGAISPTLVLSGEGDLDNFGTSVAGAGDVNGDGFDDLIVGASKNTDGGIEAGKAYVYYGSFTGVSQDNFTAVTGRDNDKLGASVQGAGDVNGDGFDDVIIGVDAYDPAAIDPGRAEVYPGGPSGLITTTTLFTAAGENEDDRFGIAVAGNGDLDGDGFSDFAAGTHEWDVNSSISTTNEGKVYAFAACTHGAISPSLIFSDTGEAPFDSYGRSLAIVNDVNGDNLDDLIVGAYGAKNSVALPTGKIYAYYGVEGGCQPALEVTKTVGLARDPALYTNTSVITVPLDAVVAYTYTVRNTGNVTLTQHRVIDDKLGTVAQTGYTLPPGAGLSFMVTSTPGISQTPGAGLTNIATWTGALSITSPSGVTTPTNRSLSTQAVAAAQVNFSGPTTDQDGDTIPDNVEGSEDVDKDGIPNYLDTNSDDDELGDSDEAGPDPTNPVDGDGDEVPSYLDPHEDADVAVGGLTIVSPDHSLRDQNVAFTAVITAGTNVSYTWDFGDGESATGQTTTHTYDALGVYTVSVTATNPLGEQETVKSIKIDYGIFLPHIMTIGIFQ